MLKSLKTVLVVAGLMALAALLNPSAERHRSKIKDDIAERSQLERVLGVGHLAAFASQYHSLTLVSYTTLNDKVLSVGAFGMVFVVE